MFAIPNLKAETAFEILRPWEDWNKFPIPAHVADKTQFEAWRTDPTTRHAFISGVSGLEPRMRVRTPTDKSDETGNPPALMDALVADYDTPVSDEKAMFLLKEPPVPFMPDFIVDSFSREGDKIKRRLVWRFEVPIRLGGARHAAAFFKILHSRLQLRKWLEGFDEASHKPAQYFELGRRWTPVGPTPIPKSVLLSWAVESAAGLRFNDGKDRPVVPVEKLAQAVNEKYPGRWQGEFARGSQGVRFWDVAADNERGCIVGDQGMICFTGPKSFVPWEEIFGERFIDSLRGDQWGAFLENFYYDGHQFWRKDARTNTWLAESKEDARLLWRVDGGVNASRPKGGNSDLDKLEVLIRKQNRVHGAFPFVHRKSGLILFEHKEYLNTTDVLVMDPAPPFVPDGEPVDLDKHGPSFFPWLHSFFGAAFEPVRRRPAWIPDDVPADKIQRDLYLVHLKRCYEGGVALNPQPRQAIVLAGPEGAGKTFLVTGIMASLLGPVADGSAYVVGGSDFNSVVAERPIMFVDDATPASSPDLQRRFTAMIKKLTACALMQYNMKYGSQGMVEWRGTAVLACNLDPESQRSMPSLDQSNLEKLSLFQLKRGIVLAGKDAQQAHLDKEIKLFARFLLDWEPPAWTLAPLSYRGRYGVRAYHHASLREAANATGTPNTVLEVLRDMYEDWVAAEDNAEETLSGVKPSGATKEWVWEGRSSRLHKEMSRYAPGIIGKLAGSQLQLALGILASKGLAVEKLEHGMWRIKFGPGMMEAFDPARGTES